MPSETQAQAEPTAQTGAVTTPVAPAAQPITERIEATVTPDFLKSLSKAELKALNGPIRNTIPRDSHGKAILPAGAETITAVKNGKSLAASEMAPEPEVVTTPEAAPEVVPGETAPEVEPEPTVVEPTLEEPATELEPEPTDDKLKQHRIRARDSFDDLVMRRYNNGIRDGSPISLDDCVKAEKAAQGILAPVKADNTTPVVKTVEVANTELATLRQQRREAKAAFDDEAIEKAQDAIDDKVIEIARLERQAEQSVVTKKQTEAQQRQSAWQAAQDQAVALYPDVTKPTSDNGKRLLAAKDRLFEEHKATDDPIRFRADYPLLLLRLAAGDEGIAPSTKKTVPAATKVASTRSVQPAKPAPPLVSASARTTPPNGTGKTPVAELLPSLNIRDAKKVNQQISSLLKRT